MNDLIQKAARQSPLQIAFWLSAVVFWGLFVLQEGAFALAGFGLLVLLFAIASWRARKASGGSQQPEEPPWLRPVLVLLIALMGLLLVGGLFGGQEPLDRAIDSVLVIQLVLLVLILAKDNKPGRPPDSRGSTTKQH